MAFNETGQEKPLKSIFFKWLTIIFVWELKSEAQTLSWVLLLYSFCFLASTLFHFHTIPITLLFWWFWGQRPLLKAPLSFPEPSLFLEVLVSVSVSLHSDSNRESAPPYQTPRSGMGDHPFHPHTSQHWLSSLSDSPCHVSQLMGLCRPISKKLVSILPTLIPLCFEFYRTVSQSLDRIWIQKNVSSLWFI